MFHFVKPFLCRRAEDKEMFYIYIIRYAQGLTQYKLPISTSCGAYIDIMRSLYRHGAEPISTWCGAYIDDVHIGYVACE